MTEKELHQEQKIEELRRKIVELNYFLGNQNALMDKLLEKDRKRDQWFKDRQHIMPSYDLPYMYKVPNYIEGGD